jgi:hypothetical protein
LAHCGKTVHLVEMTDTPAQDANHLHRPALLNEMGKWGVIIHTGFKGIGVSGKGLTCFDNGKEVLIPCETVICAAGQRSCRETVEKLRYSAPFVREVGDCVRPANILNAMYQAYHAAKDI